MTPRALELSENSRHRGRLSQGRRKREGSRFRWRSGARRKRLSARPVPAGQHEPSHRRVRRPDREPCRGLMLEVDRRMYRCVGRQPRRHAPCTARRLAHDGRFQSGGDVSAMWRASSASARSRSSRAAEALGDDRLGPQLKKRSAVRTLPTRSSRRKARNAYSTAGEADASRGANCSSRTLTCRAASNSTRR